MNKMLARAERRAPILPMFSGTEQIIPCCPHSSKMNPAARSYLPASAYSSKKLPAPTTKQATPTDFTSKGTQKRTIYRVALLLATSARAPIAPYRMPLATKRLMNALPIVVCGKSTPVSVGVKEGIRPIYQGKVSH